MKYVYIKFAYFPLKYEFFHLVWIKGRSLSPEIFCALEKTCSLGMEVVWVQGIDFAKLGFNPGTIRLNPKFSSH